MHISFKYKHIHYTGTATTIQKARESHYRIDLGRGNEFIIHMGDDGDWNTTHPFIDKGLAFAAGNHVESLENLVFQ